MTMEVHGIDCSPSSAEYTNPDCDTPGNQCTGLAGIEGTDDYNMICSTDLVIAIAGASFLIAALCSVPFWMCLVATIGKIKAWFLFSLSHGIAAIGFLFLGEGMILPLWGVTALNGIPFGAKFLNDSILADIVDYDEYLTANRKEATYVMAKSFIPKVVQIPAAVLPIAFMPAVGYIQPINGVVQYQPESVLIYIKCVSFIGVIAAGLAFVLKFKYKLTNTSLLEKSLQDIKEGREGIDPVSGKLWKPTDIDSRGQDERTVFYECSYFSTKTMQGVLDGIPNSRTNLQSKTKVHLMMSVGTMVGCIVGVGATIGLITHDELSFVPTLCMIGVGLMIAVNLFTYTRYFASKKLVAKLEAQDGEEGKLAKAATEESMEKFLE